ncbi:MAG TPA: ATP-binding protein [Usitatibacter sp.]|nr:ATP-binding protein [Usitatibacter sp.]
MKRTPLRRQLVLVALVAILPLAAIAALGIALIFDQQREAEQRRMLDVARALTTAVDNELNRSISGLQVLAAASEQDNLDLDSFRDLARRALLREHAWRALVLDDPEGRRIVHTDFPNGGFPPNPDPNDVKRVAMEGKPRVGNLKNGKLGYAFGVRVPIFKDGRVHYVLSALVPPGPILDIVLRQKVPQDGVISVFDAKGSRVARSRAHEQFLMTPPAPRLQEIIDTAGDEAIGTTTTLEGESIFTAFARAPDSHWSVAIGLPLSGVGVAARRTTAFYAAALALSLLGGLLAALIIARRINQSMLDLRHAAQALGAGGEPLPVESGVREVSEVADALSAAARERRTAEAERERLLQREHLARTEAETANRAKDQFLAMLGHELRNPLAAISNAAGLLEMPGATPQTGARAREIIRRQVSHLARLTDDLLDAARAILGKIELRTEPVDLAAIASHALGSLAASGRSSRHRIEPQFAEAWVQGDPMRLEQLVTNLLVNAVKYTPEGGRIAVRTGRSGGESFVIVGDDGIGMSPELAARAFDLFVQGQRDIDRSHGGLGIGLTLVRRIAELHGGSATLKSDGDDLGTEFTIRIPAAERPSGTAGAQARGTSAQRSILLIEDNDDARETMQVLLELMGHRVEIARDGVTGLEKALALAPDIAIVDLGLPGLDGFEVARRMRASALVRGTYLVALTGYGSTDVRREALEAGFDAHLTKPASIEMLGEILEAARAPASEKLA